jgi:hypothetical protein
VPGNSRIGHRNPSSTGRVDRKGFIVKFLPHLFALVVALAVSSFALPGCSAWPGVVGNLPVIVEAVTDSVAIIDAIESFVGKYFLANPNPSKQADVEAAITKVRLALVAGERVVSGVQDLTQAKWIEAFSDFQAAWQELMALVGPLGVSSQVGTAKVRATPGALVVPLPKALFVPVSR